MVLLNTGRLAATRVAATVVTNGMAEPIVLRLLAEHFLIEKKCVQPVVVRQTAVRHDAGVRPMMQEEAEVIFAVLRIPLSVENVAMPDCIHVMPRNNGNAGMSLAKHQKPLVFVDRFVKTYRRPADKFWLTN